MGFSCSLVELEEKFNANSLLLHINLLGIHRNTKILCREHGQNFETCTVKHPALSMDHQKRALWGFTLYGSYINKMFCLQNVSLPYII